MPNNVDGFNKLSPEPGLYDQLIDQQLHDQFSELTQDRLWGDIKTVDPAELPDRLGELVGRWISRALASVTPVDRTAAAIEISQAVIDALALTELEAAFSISSLTDPASRLLAVNHLSPTKHPHPHSSASDPL